MASIRQARPTRLYIAADGPRPQCGDEAAQCAAARAAATAVDWPCELKTLFREHNLGCRRAVSGALEWFFESEAEGIVLEDDCVADPEFFGFASTLLERYRDQPQVFAVCANNHQQGLVRGTADYYWSKYFHSWGWAAWRRSWRHYRDEIPDAPRMLCSISEGRRSFVRYWRLIFALCRRGHIDSWAYRFLYACWRVEGLCATPQRNLVHNVGSGAHATHTVFRLPDTQSVVAPPLLYPFAAPERIARDCAADRCTDIHHFGITPLRVWLLRLSWAVPAWRIALKRALVRAYSGLPPRLRR
jgi:hypothetical protein